MRLSPIPPAELSSKQKPLYDDMKAGIAAKYANFTTMRKDGAILGPWRAWLHDPELGTWLWGATKGMTLFRHLPEMVRQIIILAVGAKFGAAYEIYAHGAVALASGMRTLFGQQGAREIVYLVGHHCFISVTLNGFAISVPDDD